MSDQKTCKALVSHGRARVTTCGKPAKGVLKNYFGKDVPACGLHLAGERRRLANRETWEREYSDERRRDKEMEEIEEAERRLIETALALVPEAPDAIRLLTLRQRYAETWKEMQRGEV